MHQIFQLHALLHHFSCFKISFSILLTFKLTFFHISLRASSCLRASSAFLCSSATLSLFFSFTLCFCITLFFRLSVALHFCGRCFPPRYCAVLLLVSQLLQHYYYSARSWARCATTRSWFIVIMIFPVL